MKVIFAIIALIISCNVFSQMDSLLWGKWNVVGSFDGNILHDYTTDSTMQLTTESKILSRKDLLAYASTTKDIYISNSYEFTREGVFIHYLDDSVYFKGNYKIDKVEQLIIASKSNSWERTVSETFKYSTDGSSINLLIMDKKEDPFVNTTFSLIFKLYKVK